VHPLCLQWQVTRLRLPLPLFNDDKDFWWENPEERDHWKEPGVDGNNIKADLQDVGWGHGLDFSGSEYRQVAGACECGMDFWFRKMWGIY
jgi:hypothetical protein